MDEFVVYLDFSHVSSEVFEGIFISRKWLPLSQTGQHQSAPAKSPASHAKYLWAQEREKIIVYP